MTVVMADTLESPKSLADQVEEAEKGIRAGFVAALISMGMTLLFTILGATGVLDMGLGILVHVD